jgi:phosphoglycolate phosphatase-like HAD superfamily hydrolase
MRVLLFDIDGTLIHTGGAGGAALLHAFASLFQIPTPRDVPFSGRTDRAIGRDLFTLHEIADSAENWTRLSQEYLVQLPVYLPRRTGRVLPGVSELLDRLAQERETALGLLTGNLRDGARLKLEHYRLYHHFAFGGYGDEHEDRNHVAESALSAARRHLNGRAHADGLWVIGDTPLDIRCARWIGAKVLAVATGGHSRDELASHQPDLLLDDLADVDHVLSLMG